jgi:tRNA1Val (adenine37-N6)-methyltransferase
VTLDRPAPGLVVAQPRRGFRYGSEAFWLVGFALEGGVPRTALDLGTGSGIAALLLARLGVVTVGVDVRGEWEPLWERTLHLSDPMPVSLRVGDAGRLAGPRVDLVVSNPPFFAAGSGPVAPDPWKRAARTESTATLADFVRAGVALGARACLVVPTEREAEIVALAHDLGAGVSRWVRVGRRRVLVELIAGVRTGSGPVEIGEDADRVRSWLRVVRAAG